jgi:hypothetical protein
MCYPGCAVYDVTGNDIVPYISTVQDALDVLVTAWMSMMASLLETVLSF